MKTRITTVLATFVLSQIVVSNVFANDQNLILQQRIDSLETRLDSICLEQNEHIKLETEGSYSMGTGLFTSAKTGTYNYADLELGYMFITGNAPKVSLEEAYIGQRNDYRYGFSAGLQMYSDETVFMNDSTFYNSSGYGAFGKFNFASPVLMNYISFSCHLKTMYLLPSKDNDHNITENRMGWGYGYDVDFWITKRECATIGYSYETDTAFGQHKDDPIYPAKVRFAFGLKKFF